MVTFWIRLGKQAKMISSPPSENPERVSVLSQPSLNFYQLKVEALFHSACMSQTNDKLAWTFVNSNQVGVT